jgi:GNAT superfamily N-acetyltransferase
LLEELGHPLGPEIVARQLDRIRECGKSYFVVVAILDERTVGLVSGFATPVLHREQPVGRISVLVVARSHAGTGLGSALLREAEERLRAQDCVRVELTSAAHRTEAHDFYGRKGYRRQGLRFVREIQGTETGGAA